MARTQKITRNPKPNGSADLVYQIKVTLRGIRPPIWRSIQVTGDTLLWVLHGVLQTVMGWNDEHPHRFLINETYYGEPGLPGADLGVVDEEAVGLSQLMSAEVTRFLYQYGSGTGWDHEILIEKILPRGDGEKYPFCRDGNRACPPEDCKGPSGYRKFLKTLNGSSHTVGNKGHERVDQDFDAEKFDVKETNRRLGWS